MLTAAATKALLAFCPSVSVMPMWLLSHVGCSMMMYDDARLCTLLLADASNVYEHGIVATPLSGGGAEEGGAEEGGAEEGGAEEGGAEEGGAEEGGAEEGGTGEGGKQPAFLL